MIDSTRGRTAFCATFKVKRRTISAVTAVNSNITSWIKDPDLTKGVLPVDSRGLKPFFFKSQVQKTHQVGFKKP